MTVYIARENNNIKQAIKRILDAFKDNLDLSKGIFLKPNIVFPVKEESGEITRHCVVTALIEALREIKPDIDIIIGEGTAAGSIPEENFKISGYTALANRLSVKLIDLNTAERIKVNWHYGNLFLPKIALERTYINLPILKKSTAAGISGALKNQKGLLSPGVKKGFHRLGLHKPIAHLNQVVQPGLSILDGNNFFKKNILIGGNSTAEIDHFVSGLLCSEIPEHVDMSMKIGLVQNSYTIAGDKTDNFFGIKIDSPAEVKHFLRVRLWSNPRACSMCRYLFQDVKKISSSNFKYTVRMWLKLIKYSIVGADIIYGSKPSFSGDAKNIICIGNCNKRLAKKMGYRFVPGCPPTKEDMLEYF